MIPIVYSRRIDKPHLAMIFCAPRGPAPAREAMAMERWSPKQEPTRQEQVILKRLERKRKLFGFLRKHRHELFDDAFQACRWDEAAGRPSDVVASRFIPSTRAPECCP